MEGNLSTRIAEIRGKEVAMGALLVLLIILFLFGAGFALKVLWYLAIAALILWVIGFLAHGPERRWYRW
jgi:hypothetical protein